MKDLIGFFSFQDPNTFYVTFGAILITVSAAMVGCFSFLQKKALTGDAVAHAVLPGVCLGFILSGTKDPVFLVTGAFATGWLSLLFVDKIVEKSKIKEDTAIGLILSVFFGLGVLMLSVIQHSGNANQTGLESFLFGKAAALVEKDLITFSIICTIIMVTVFAFFKDFMLISFDKPYARSMGVPVKLLDFMLTSLTVLAVVVGIQAVGVVLMAAMLITPAAAARAWTDNLRYMVFIAAVLGMLSGVFGTFISYVYPSMPTGPWIVMIISALAIFSLFFGIKRGIVFKAIKVGRFKQKIVEENLMKLFYQLGEKEDDFFRSYAQNELLERGKFTKPQLISALFRAEKEGFIEIAKKQFKLTKEGLAKGQRTLKLHRLWEVYLTEYLRIAPDHVHEDAESIEHIITPELEEKLEKLLDYPTTDPHLSKIPYRR